MLHNIRMGFAHNSSSTHSIVFIRNDIPEDTGIQEGYGWENFVLSTSASKQHYLAAQVHLAIESKCGVEISNIVTKSLFSAEFESDDFCVDHESILCFPANLAGNLDMRFISDFEQFLLRDDVVIFGGNDNDESDFKLGTDIKEVRFLKRSGLISRFDNEHNFWTLYNKFEGTKIRVRLTGDLDIPITKSSSPELVDVKITDYCTYRCDYCYQGSTSQGKHGDVKDLEKLAWMLHSWGVFEVVLGGGEPTSHPEFAEVVSNFARNHLTVNFTTRSRYWLSNIGEDKFLTEELRGKIGSIAYSVDEFNDLMFYAQHAVRVKAELGILGPPTIQVVVGVPDEDEFERILRFAFQLGYGVTLLGFKSTHRGSTYKKKHNYNWLDVVKRVQMRRSLRGLGVDTVLAQEYKSLLEEEGIDNVLFTTEEGKFSMYFDMVEKKYGPSSFCVLDHEWNGDRNRMLEVYKTF